MSKIISEKDKEILKLLIKQEEGITAYRVTQLLYKTGDILRVCSNAEYIRKRLEVLTKKRIVIKLNNSYPVFYKINRSMRIKEFIEIKIFQVECPACKKRSWVFEGQLTKKCICKKRIKSLEDFGLLKRGIRERLRLFEKKEKAPPESPPQRERNVKP